MPGSLNDQPDVPAQAVRSLQGLLPEGIAARSLSEIEFVQRRINKLQTLYRS